MKNYKKGAGKEFTGNKWIVGSIASYRREMKMLKQLKRFKREK